MGIQNYKMVEYYYVLQCPSCGNFQTKIYRDITLLNIKKKTFKCQRCGKSTMIKKSKEFGMSVKNWGPFTNGSYAAELCGKLKWKAKI